MARRASAEKQGIPFWGSFLVKVRQWMEGNLELAADWFYVRMYAWMNVPICIVFVSLLVTKYIRAAAAWK